MEKLSDSNVLNCVECYNLNAIDDEWRRNFVDDIIDNYGIPLLYDPKINSIYVTGSSYQIAELDEYYCDAVRDSDIPGYQYQLEIHGHRPVGIEQDPDFRYELTHAR